jgi:hypothetical protein
MKQWDLFWHSKLLKMIRKILFHYWVQELEVIAVACQVFSAIMRRMRKSKNRIKLSNLRSVEGKNLTQEIFKGQQVCQACWKILNLHGTMRIPLKSNKLIKVSYQTQIIFYLIERIKRAQPFYLILRSQSFL